MGLPAECTQLMQTYSTTKIVGEARAESDHIAFNSRFQLPTGDNAPPAPTNRQTTLAQSMPNDTVFYWEMHNLGDTLGWAIKNMLSCATGAQSQSGPQPSSAGGITDPSKLFEQLAGAKPEEYLDFIDDAALGISYTDDKIGAGIVATVDDEATAKARVNKILGLLQLAGGGFGGGSSANISTEELNHNGTTVTVITMAGPGSDTAPLSIQVAVANGRFYLGLDDFVTSALDRNASDSLASNARYQKALSGSPSDTAGVGYVDVAALAEAYEEFEQGIQGGSSADFDTNTKPFIDPLSSLVFVSHVDGGVLVSNMNLFVE